MSSPLPRPGQTYSYQRTFTVEDVELFTRVTGDVGRHHLVPDEKGRLMVHGLLTATLPTRIGGEINYVAREMTFEFVRPVHTGDTITTEVVIRQIVDEDKVFRLHGDAVCKNQHGKEVLKCTTHGVIFK